METSYKSDPIDDIGKSFWTEIDAKLPKSFTPQNPQFAGTFVKEAKTVIDPEDNSSSLLKPISQLSSQLMGPLPKDLRRPETEHCKVMAAKLPEVCAQPKILLEKLCFDSTSRNSTSGAIKLSGIFESHRESGLENGELKRRSNDGASEYGEVVCLKRRSPSSVTNKKKPYRSVARSEQIANEKRAAKSFNTSSCSQNVIERSQEESRVSIAKMNGEEQKTKEYASHQPRSYSNQANKDTFDDVPELYSNRTTLNDVHSSRFSVKNAEFFRAAVNNNSSNNDQYVELHDKAQYSCPRSRHVTPSGYFNVVSDVPLSKNGGDSDETRSEQNANRNRSLKLTFSRVYDVPPLPNDRVDSQSNSIIKTPATVPGSDKRGLMVARLMPARSLTKLQRVQFVRKSRKPCLKQRFVRTDSTERLFKGEKEPSCDAKPQFNGGKLYADVADDHVKRLPPKKVRLSPENEIISPIEPTSANVSDRAKAASDGLNFSYDQRSHAEGHAVSRQREMPKTLDEFRDIVDKPRPSASFAFKAKPPRELPSKTDSVCRSISDAISDWDAAAASAVGASKDDDRITSTGSYSSAEVHPAIANKRENIFEKFRSPIEAQEVAGGTAESSKPLGRSTEAKAADRQTVQEPQKDTAPGAAAVSSKDSKDIKELFGDCDSDSTECCKYEDLDQFFDNSATNGGQIGGLVGRSGSFYHGFSPFHLPSDSDDNLIVDESAADIQPAGIEEINNDDATKNNAGGPSEEQEPEEDHQLKKLRCTAYRNYARMQRKRGGNVQKSEDINPQETTSSSSLVEDTSFKPPDGPVTPVCRKRTVNSPKKSTINTIKAKKRKKIALNNSNKSSAAYPDKSAPSMEEEKDKDKGKDEDKDKDRESPCFQKPIRLSKKFITRSKARTIRLDGGKPVQYGRRKGTAAAAKTQGPTVEDDGVPKSAEDPEIRPGVDGISAESVTNNKLRKKGATRGKVKTANETGTIKKQGKPGKTKVAIVKDGLESEPASEPPKIDILSRELGPRYNWLEQKIQAMQRSNSDETSAASTSELVKSHVQKILSAVGSEKRQTMIKRSTSDEEKRGGSRTKRPNQASKSSGPGRVTSEDFLTKAAEKRTTGGEDTDISNFNHWDIRFGFAHIPSSAGVDLSGVFHPMSTLGTPEATKARPSSVESAPSALEILPPENRICDLGYAAMAAVSATKPATSGNDLPEFETRSEPSSLPLSKSVAVSYKRTPRFRRNYALPAEELGAEVRSSNPDASLERSLSLTNLDPESDQGVNPAKDPPRGDGHYRDVLLEPYLDCPVPFDLRLPTARCYGGSSDNDALLPVEMSSFSSLSKGSSTHMLPLKLTISPRGRSDSSDGLASRRASLDSASAMERQPVRASNEPNDLIALAASASAIVIDLTAESEPPAGPAADPAASKEGDRPDPGPGSIATPILSSIKHEYDRRLEMYERLSKVSRIKDQEIAILESERKRVKNELEYLKNVYLKATSGHPQATDFAGPILPSDVSAPSRSLNDAYDLRKATEAHNRESSTVSLLSSPIPPDAHSAKTDLSMYTYLKCRYERERLALSITEPSEESETSVPGPPLRNHPEVELSSAQVPTSSASVTFRQPVRPVAQRDPANVPNHCGSNEAAWSGSDSSPVQPQSHFEIPPPLINDRTSLKADARRTLEPYRKEPEQDLYLSHEPLKLLGPLPPPPGNSFSTAQQQQQSKADAASRDHPQGQQRSTDVNRERCDGSSVQRSEYLPTTMDQPNALPVPRDAESDDRLREAGSFGHHQTQCEAVDLSGGRNGRRTEKEKPTFLPPSSTDVLNQGDNTLHRLTDADGVMMPSDRPPPQPPVAEYVSAEAPLALNLKSVSRADDSVYPGNRAARIDPGLDTSRIQKPVSERFLDLYESGNRTKANSTELDEEGSADCGASKLVIQTDETRKGLIEESSGSANYQKSIHRFRLDREKKLVKSEGDRSSSMTQSSSPVEGFRRTTPNEQIPVSNQGRIPPTNSGAVNSVEIDPGLSARQSIPEITPQEQRVSRGKTTEVSMAPTAPYPSVSVAGPGNKGEAPGPAAKRWTKPQVEPIPPYADKEGISSNLQDMNVMVNSIVQDSFPRKNTNKKSSPHVAPSEKQQRNGAATTATTTTTPQSDVLMTASPGYSRNIHQRRPERVEQRQGAYPAEPPPQPHSQPQMAMYRRDIVHGGPEYPGPVPEPMAALVERKRDVEMMRLQARAGDGLVFDGPGGVHSLQRYNELHQAMNHQARQPPQQQHFGSPVPAGLSPRDPAFAPPPSMRTEAAAVASSRVLGVQQVSPNDLSRFGKQPPPPESLHFGRIVGPVAAAPHPPAQIPVPRPPEGGHPQQRTLANVPLQAEVNQGQQQVMRKEGYPITGYQKGGLPPDTHLRQHGFHLDQPVVHRLPYHRDSGGPPPDFTRNPYAGIAPPPPPRAIPEMQREGVAVVVRPDESLLIAAAQGPRNEAVMAGRVLRQDVQGKLPKPPADKGGEFYEPNAAAVGHPGIEHRGYVPLAPGSDPSGALVWRVNKPDSNPVIVRGHPVQDERRTVQDYHVRHLDQRPLVQPVVVDPTKGPPSVSGVRDAMRLQQQQQQPGPSMVGDCYLPAYMESISGASQSIPYRSQNAIHSSQIHLPRQPDPSKAPHVLPRHPDQLGMQLPPPPAPGMYNETMRLIPHNQLFYPPPAGILPPEFIPGNGPPGVLLAERIHIRPGFDQHCSSESYAPNPYAAGVRAHLGGTGVRVGPTMASPLTAGSQPPPIPGTSSRQRQHRQEEGQPHVVPGGMTRQAKVPPSSSQDAYKVQQQQMMNPSSANQMGKAGDYICDVCRKQAMFVCSACRGIAYCSTDCQAISWQTKHSAVCRQL